MIMIEQVTPKINNMKYIIKPDSKPSKPNLYPNDTLLILQILITYLGDICFYKENFPYHKNNLKIPLFKLNNYTIDNNLFCDNVNIQHKRKHHYPSQT